jgi:hypothetical protein
VILLSFSTVLKADGLQVGLSGVFNTLWVWFPLWVLYEAYNNINGAFAKAGEGAVSKEKKVMNLFKI